MATTNEGYWAAERPSSPQHANMISTSLPDSPEDLERFATNSDDLQPTSHLSASDVVIASQQQSRCFLAQKQPITIVGSHDKPITLGRGGCSTIKIGRRNRQISRTHVSISYKNDSFELTVVGLNGACVDGNQVAQHEVVTLENDSFIDILGDHFSFKVPPPRLNFNNLTTKQMKKPISGNKDILREMSPDAEERQQQVLQEQQQPITATEQKPAADKEEEEEYPVELVPEDALSSADEKELSPEPVAEKEEEKAAVAKEQQVVKEEKKTVAKKEQASPLQESSNKKVEEVVEVDTNDYAEVIIDALVFSRTSSMPISDICSRILKANPVYAKQPRALWIERIRAVLKERPFFGEIERKGKTADGSPVENLYYYNSELDPVEWRRATYTQVGRSARKCTLKDKQYFWKIPPKLGRHRSSYIPPPASNDLKRQRSHQQQEQQDDENVDPKKMRI